MQKESVEETKGGSKAYSPGPNIQSCAAAQGTKPIQNTLTRGNPKHYPSKTLARLFLNNQFGGLFTIRQSGHRAITNRVEEKIGISLSAVVLLALAHGATPRIRPYTARFLTLSYGNSSTGKYAAGPDDFYFMALCAALLMGLRAGCMEYVLAPLARRWRTSGKKDTARFSEQGWMLIYYSVFWPLGMVCRA